MFRLFFFFFFSLFSCSPHFSFFSCFFPSPFFTLFLMPFLSFLLFSPLSSSLLFAFSLPHSLLPPSLFQTFSALNIALSTANEKLKHTLPPPPPPAAEVARGCEGRRCKPLCRIRRREPPRWSRAVGCVLGCMIGLRSRCSVLEAAGRVRDGSGGGAWAR